MAELSEDIWQYVWLMLDAEPDVTTHDAGSIAAQCEKKFRDAMTKFY